MKKNLFYYLFAVICSVSLFTSCSDDDDEKVVCPVGETTFTDKSGLQLTYSSAPMLGKMVQFVPQGNKAVLTLSGAPLDLSGLQRDAMSAPSGLTTAGVVPGELTTTLNVDLKIEGDKVSFEGTDKKEGRVLTYKGEATPSGMKLDVNVTMPTMGLAGTSWNLASLDKEEPTAPLHIVWKENHDEVEMEEILKLMISMIPVENSTIPQLLDGVLKKVTFLPDGNIQAEYKDNPTDEAFKTSPLNLAMYSMDGDNKIRVYLNVNQIMAVADTKSPRTSIEEALPALKQIILPMLAEGVPVFYREKENGNVAFYLGYDVFQPLLAIAGELVKDEALKAALVELVKENAGPLGGFAAAFVKQILDKLPDIIAVTEDVQIGIDLISAK